MVKVPFTIRLDEAIIKKLDEEASKRGLSRSKFIEHVLAEYLNVKIKEDPCITIEELRRGLEDCRSRIKVLEEEIQRLKSEISRQ